MNALLQIHLVYRYLNLAPLIILVLADFERHHVAELSNKTLNLYSQPYWLQVLKSALGQCLLIRILHLPDFFVVGPRFEEAGILDAVAVQESQTLHQLLILFHELTQIILVPIMHLVHSHLKIGCHFLSNHFHIEP